ncbi:hypothetical protein RZS08_07860, partial [Arthrospira platensis SPKY1]|nr:hypothetical protein [Arthrospira platensis SPKY1]
MARAWAVGRWPRVTTARYALERARGKPQKPQCAGAAWRALISWAYVGDWNVRMGVLGIPATLPPLMLRRSSVCRVPAARIRRDHHQEKCCVAPGACSRPERFLKDRNHDLDHSPSLARPCRLRGRLLCRRPVCRARPA